MNTISSNPYIGPRTFQKNEGHLFYGREREARDLIALVASERLVVFYAQSGAGKSSIVNTRLIPNLETKEYEVLPVGRVAGDSAESIDVENIYVYNLLRSLEQHETVPAVLSKLSLSDFLAHLNIDENGFFYDSKPLEAIQEGDNVEVVRRALVIDQFEELFSTHPEAWEKRDDFFQQLAKAMEDDPYLWVVLVMREDYIAALDPYAHYIENGLRVRYYMQRLEREAALKAVTSPVKELRPYANGVAEKLIDDLCSIAVLKPDGTPDVQPGQYVEPVQLQVVCYGLWNNLSPDGKQITEKDLEDVGDVGQSLGKHYDGRVSEVAKAKKVKERLIREWFEKKLITAGGIRNMVLQEHEPKPGELDDDVIQALQSDLVRGEKRGGATWYELTHDRLVDPILQSNEIWFEEHLSPLQRQAALWNEQNRQESWLLSGHALVEVEVWAGTHQEELTETEQEFLKACQKLQLLVKEKQEADRQQLEIANKLAVEQARSAKRARLFNIVSGILIVVAIYATVSSSNSAKEAARNEEEADKAKKEALHQSDIARSSELSTIAIERSNSELDLAMLLGVRANAFDSNPQTQKSLLTLLQRSNRYKGIIKGGDDIGTFPVQYSPDGKTLATLGKNGITLWDAENKSRLNDTPLTGHYGAVTALAISQDRALMASGGADGTIVIWDAKKPERLSEPLEGNAYIRSLAFSPDENANIMASVHDDGAIIFWDITNPENPLRIGKPLLDRGSGPILAVAFTPDGKTLATGYGDASIIFWDVETHSKIGEPLEGHLEAVFGLAFSSDNKTLASGSYDDTVILWDVSDLTAPSEIITLKGHMVDIETIAISPDGNTLASGDDAGDIILWDIPTRKRLTDPALNAETSWVVSLAFSPDGSKLASGSYTDGKVALWDVSDPKTSTQIGETLLAHNNNNTVRVAFGNNEKLITAAEDSNINIWDISNPENPQKIGAPLQGHPGQTDNMYFSPDGSLIASAGNDGTVLFDVQTQQKIGVAIPFSDFSEIFLTNLDESILAYQIQDLTTKQITIHLLDKSTSQPIGDPIDGQDPVFSPDGKKLVYRTPDKNGIYQLHLLDFNSEHPREVSFPKTSTYSAFSADSQILIYQTKEQSIDQEAEKIYINVWDLNKWKNIGEDIEGSFSAFTSDGRTLIYQSANPVTNQPLVNLWDTRTAKDMGFSVEGSYVAINSDSRTLLVKTMSNVGDVISLWDIVKEVKLTTITGKSDAYFVSANGNILAYMSPESKEPSIYLLDTATGEPQIEAPIKGDAILALSENGRVLLYSINENTETSSIIAVNTYTGRPIGDPLSNIYSQSRIQSVGKFLKYEAFTNVFTGSGRTRYSLINTETAATVGNDISGTYDALILVQAESIMVYQTSDNKLIVQNANTGNLIHSIDDGYLLAIDHDQEFLLYQTSEKNNNFINLLDIEKGRNFGEPFRGRYEAFSPDGKTLITRSDENDLIFWDLTKTWPLGDLVTEKNNKVETAALSPDGRKLAIYDADGITIRDMANNTTIGQPLANTHIGFVEDVHLSPDKNKLLSFGEDGKSIVWDLETLQQLSDPIIGGSGFFSPKGGFAVVIDRNQNTITLWEVSSNRTIGEPFAGDNVVFSPDEKIMAVLDGNNYTATLWDLTSMQQIGAALTGYSVLFSPDSKAVAVINNVGEGYTNTFIDLVDNQVIDRPVDGSIISGTEGTNTFLIFDPTQTTYTFWDWVTRKPIADPIAGNDTVFTNTEINILVVRDYENNATTLWNPTTGSQIGKNLAGLYYPSFSPDGALLSMADENTNETIIWDVKAQEQIGSIIAGYQNPTFCNDNKTIAWFDTSRTTVVFWDLEKDESLGEKIFDEDSGITITFGPGCELVALADYSQNETSLWDIKNEDAIGKTISGSSQVLFSSDGSSAAVVDNNRGVTTIRQLASTTTVDVEIEGGYVITTPETPDIFGVEKYDPSLGSSTFTIWNLALNKQIGSELPHWLDLHFTASGKLIIYGRDGISFWDVDAVDLANPVVGKPLQGHISPITNILFSPNGKIMVSLASNGIVRTDLDTRESVPLTAKHFSSMYNPDNTMAFSSDGNRLTALSRGGTIYVWDVASNPPVLQDSVEAPYKEFINELYRYALSPDGSHVIYEFNSKLYIWNIDTEKFVGDPDDPIKTEVCCGGALVFSPDGDSIYYSDGGAIVRLDDWKEDPVEVGEISTGQSYVYSLSLVMDHLDPSVTRYLFSYVDNNTTQIWNWTKESKIGDPISGNFQILGVNSDAQLLIYLDTDDELIKLDLDPETWVMLMCEKTGRNLTKKEWRLYIGDSETDKNALSYQKVCPNYALEP